MAEAKPVLVIEYCTQCRWLLRAAWTAQELLTTFAEQLGGVTLKPATGGIFRIYEAASQDVVWDRAKMQGFAEMKELKQLVRDRIAPSLDLGHSERR